MEFIENIDEADFILLGAPVDQGTENKGCSEAPAKIREKMDNFFFSESANNRTIHDSSDIVEGETFEITMDRIFNKVRETLKMHKPIVLIGGNHSVTLPVIQGYSRHFNRMGVIFIDAHPDCQPDYFPYGDVIGGVSSIPEVNKTVLLGLRNWSKTEYQFLLENNIPFITMKDIYQNSMDYVISRVKEMMRDVDAIYISFDIDAVDPAFAPGTGWIEPGGLTSRQAIHLVQELAKMDRVEGFDIVEVNPEKDTNGITSSLAAKLILEFVDSYGSQTESY
ncbi:MAG TPA: arginase family protein [Candidatus Woesearchaeota archaeon]|nr:arginase family protein [Candidatus Woesearchaeota archaeon]